MDELLARITVDDEICNGQPVIRGMRITVQTVIEFLLAGTSEEELLHQYPVLEPEDLAASKYFATRLMGQRFTFRTIAA